METQVQSLLDDAQNALINGKWSDAKTSFEALLEREESAEALLGLGNALWWLGETEASIRRQERAYAIFRHRPDPEQAVVTAISLCLTYRASLGNYAASRGWLERAARIVEESKLAPLKGWVYLCRAVVANDNGHPGDAETWALQARETAHASSDRDLDLCALSELGAALVELGRLDEGAALLDEAMAGTLGGEIDSIESVVMTSCNTVTCCSRSGDFKRAVQWIRAADEFNRRYGSPHLYTTCRIHYGSILFATGEWDEAEREFDSALSIGRAAEPELYAQALGKLAELRVAQGRVEEAAWLLAGYEHRPTVTGAVAALHLARGEAMAAELLLRRRLQQVAKQHLESSALLELLVDARIGRGAGDLAMKSAQHLSVLASEIGAGLIAARADRAMGRVLGFVEDTAAIGHLEDALGCFTRLEMPFEAARTRLFLARTLATVEPEAAIAEARRALETFDHLNAGRCGDEAAALLRSLGVKAARSGPKGLGLLTKREREVLSLLGEGLSNPEIAERLVISRKTVEHHVAHVLAKLNLSGRSEAAAYAVRSQEQASAKR